VGVSGLWTPGAVIADLYEVRGINTEGGMAIVYFVWHTAWHMELVIKSPKPDVLVDDGARRRFLDEAETWVKLGAHPNIVTAHYARELEGFPRIVIEKMDGGSLKQWIRDGRVGDLATALDIAIQIASGLAYAERRRPGFVHRDIKPANVLMTPDGEARVTDFGLVGAAGACVGTPAYMAPETWGGADEVTPAADLYSFGIVLYELLTGRRPFEPGDAGGSLGQIRARRAVEASQGALRVPARASRAGPDDASLGVLPDIQRAADASLGELTVTDLLRGARPDEVTVQREWHTRVVPVPPDRFVPDLPRDIRDLCLALLEKRPSDRPARAADVAERLRRAYEGATGGPYPRTPPQEAALIADSLNNSALSFLDLANEREAIRCWQEAILTDPAHLETSVNLGHWQWQRGMVDDAQYVNRLTDLERTHGGRPEYWQAMAAVSADRGDEAGARAAADRAPRQEGEARWDDAPRLRQEHAATAPEPLASVAASTDEALVLAGGNGGWLGTFDARRLEPVRTYKAVGAYEQRAVAFWGRPAFFAGTHGRDVMVWNTEGGGQVGALTPPKEAVEDEGVSANTASALTVSQDGTLLAVGYAFGMGVSALQPILVWDLRTGRLAGRLAGHADTVSAVCLTRDNRYVVSAGAEYGGGEVVSLAEYGRSKGPPPRPETRFIRLWELRSGACVADFEEQRVPVNALALSPDGRTLASGDREGQVRLWDMRSQRCLRSFLGHAGHVRAVTFVCDGAFVASGGEDRVIKVWEVASGRCARTLDGHTDTVRGLAWLERAHLLLSVGRDKTVRSWTLRPEGRRRFAYLLARPRSTGELLRSEAAVERACREADGLLAAGDVARAYATLRAAQGVRGHERDEALASRIAACTAHGSRTGLRQAGVVADYGPFDEAVTAARFSPDGSLVAVADDAGRVRVWHVDVGTVACEFKAQALGVAGLAWMPDGTHVVCCSRGSVHTSTEDDPTLQLWDARAGRRVPWAPEEPGRLGAVCVMPSGLIATGTWGSRMDRPAERAFLGGDAATRPPDNVVRLWHPASAKPLHAWVGHEDAVTALAAAPDGLGVASASRDRTVRLWNLSSPHSVGVLRGHAAAVLAVAFAPDGRVLSGGTDDRLRLWSRATGACLRELVGHADTVHAVAFSPDGRFAFSASEDRTLRLWDTASGAPLRTFEGHTDGVFALDVSPDGRYLVSGGADRLAKLWALDWEWEFATAP
jgi:WD40 repeat protein/serine/threonine protein kinase